MTNQANIFLESPIWEENLPNYEDLIEEAIDTVKQHFQDLPAEATMSVVLADDAFIQTLNLKYRGKEKPTNVLSFPAHDDDDPNPGDELGDIVLAYETIAAEAAEQNKTVEHHVQHLIIHGFLHLMGYDHEEDDEADHMESLEIQLLEQLGIANPYDESAHKHCT
jgi:probable rRNA maturation factor